MRRFSSESIPSRTATAGSERRRSTGIAPPWTLRTRPWRSSTDRSRRMVSGVTSKVRARPATSARPSARAVARIAWCLSGAYTSTPSSLASPTTRISVFTCIRPFMLECKPGCGGAGQGRALHCSREPRNSQAQDEGPRTRRGAVWIQTQSDMRCRCRSCVRAWVARTGAAIRTSTRTRLPVLRWGAPGPARHGSAQRCRRRGQPCAMIHRARSQVVRAQREGTRLRARRSAGLEN